MVDSAFYRRRYPLFIKSSQDSFIDSENALDVIRFHQATAALQASQWSMQALQDSFLRIEDRMVYEEQERRKPILV